MLIDVAMPCSDRTLVLYKVLDVLPRVCVKTELDQQKYISTCSWVTQTCVKCCLCFSMGLSLHDLCVNLLSLRTLIFRYLRFSTQFDDTIWKKKFSQTQKKDLINLQKYVYFRFHQVWKLRFTVNVMIWKTVNPSSIAGRSDDSIDDPK